MAKNLLSRYKMILSRDHQHMLHEKNFLSQNLSHYTATFVLRYAGYSERLFSFIGFSKSCNICKPAISQNIAHLHHIDLYGNIF